MLRQVDDLVWVATHGTILITSQDQVYRYTPPRVFPLADLVDAKGLSAVTELLAATVQPSSWSVMGGEGDLRAYERAPLIFVRQDEAGQEAVLALLSKLRAASDRPLLTESPQAPASPSSGTKAAAAGAAAPANKQDPPGEAKADQKAAGGDSDPFAGRQANPFDRSNPFDN